MSDCVLFASLFAAYAVLHGEVATGPSAAMLFDPSFVLTETVILLSSSFACGLATLAAMRGRKLELWLALLVTLGLGLGFLGMELSEFSRFIAAGHSWKESAFLSSFFTLVGTHGLHILAGSLWMLTLLGELAIRGITPRTTGRVVAFSLFWHFLDVVWVCIFSFVYLFGILSP